MDNFIKNIEAKNLKDAFYTHITEQNIKSGTDAKIYSKGKSYLDNITEIEGFKNQIIAEVSGTDDYEVVLEYDKDKSVVTASCTCPYFDEGICKHIVATALYTLQNRNKIFEDVEDEISQNDLKPLNNDQLLEKIAEKLKKITKKEVQGMGPQKLKNLVLEIKELTDKSTIAEDKIKPRNEVTGIVVGGIYMENAGIENAKNTPTISEKEKAKQQKIFDEVKDTIDKILDVEYVDNIPLFEKKLDKNLEKLNDLDNIFLKEICNYYIELVDSLTKMENEDLLWAEWWNGRSETYYEGTNFNEYLIALLKKLNEDEIFEWGVEFYKVEDGEHYTGTFSDIENWIKSFFQDNKEIMKKLVDVFLYKSQNNTFVGSQEDKIFYLIKLELTTEQHTLFLGNSYLEDNEYLESYVNSLKKEGKIEEIQKVYEAKFKQDNYEFSWKIEKYFDEYVATFQSTLDKFNVVNTIESWIKLKEPTAFNELVLSKYLELLFELKQYDKIKIFCENFVNTIEKSNSNKIIFFDCSLFYLKYLKVEEKNKEIINYLQKIEKSQKDFNLNFLVLYNIFVDFRKEITTLASQKLYTKQYIEFLRESSQTELSEEVMLKNFKNLNDSFISPFFKNQDIQKKYPNETKKYFENEIKKLQINANQSNYQIIGDYLVEISKIDTPKAQEIAKDLKNKYKIRKNLMLILEKLEF